MHPNREIFDFLKNELLLQVGNRKSNNIDFLVITSSMSREMVYDILQASYSEVWVSDDAIQFLYEDKTWSFVVFTETEFQVFLDLIFAQAKYGEVREWVLGYWIPEGFLLDILHGEIVFDKENKGEMLQETIATRWQSFTENLMKHIEKEIACKEAIMKHKETGDFWYRRCEMDVQLAKARLENLQKEIPVTHFGYMHLQ